MMVTALKHPSTSHKFTFELMTQHAQAPEFGWLPFGNCFRPDCAIASLYQISVFV